MWCTTSKIEKMLPNCVSPTIKQERVSVLDCDGFWDAEIENLREIEANIRTLTLLNCCRVNCLEESAKPTHNRSLKCFVRIVDQYHSYSFGKSSKSYAKN